MTGQVKFGLVKSDRSTNFCTQNLFGPEIHLRMEFDSGVGPTCFVSIIDRKENPAKCPVSSVGNPCPVFYSIFVDNELCC